jgi:MFS family permease
MSDEHSGGGERKGPLAEITQPFIDLARAPRALWGVNISYLIEGLVYFGIVMLLSEYFNQYVGLNDVRAGWMVGVLTYGITLSMGLFGGLADRFGVRIALFGSIALMLAGRLVLCAGTSLGLRGGWVSPLHLVAMLGILLVVLGYGMYQPAAYSAVRQFTTEKTASMGYAMLYAVMNLGGWLPTFVSPPIRKAHGIVGVYWTYAAITAATLLITVALLSRRTVDRALAEAKAAAKPGGAAGQPAPGPRQPFSLVRWLKNHPLADARFAFFIFCLIPAQTLFAHNWLTLPMYVERAYDGTWLGDNFEAASSFNSLLIFVLVPLVAALMEKVSVFYRMIYGTAAMALPTFLLAIGPSFWTLLAYLVFMTIGEAIWQPRFLQYAAEIAPEGRSGAYMGVAQLPWFLTKFITSLYSGWFLTRYCPKPWGVAEAPLPFWGSVRFNPRLRQLHTETMWLIYALISICTAVLLTAGKRWLDAGAKAKR